MKVYQSTLSIGQHGVVLKNSTNLHNNAQSKPEIYPSKKRKNTFDENEKPSKTRKDGIYVDKKIKLVDSTVQTLPMIDVYENAQAIEGKSSEECLKSLAEERREALSETLKANELLTQENDLLKVENLIIMKEKEALKEENRKLKEENDCQKEEILVMEEMLDEAKHLASMVKDITDRYDESET